MNGEIRVELDDLLRAERHLTELLAQLRMDEQEARSLYASLQNWKGHSANVLKNQIEAFFEDMSRRILDIEQQKMQLVQYVQHMRQVDNMAQ
ncbi:hypothetical protein [Paenibacillus lemnae]|uniref:WXG100 family type VII secretion target n=1 Tax=Paenibacillus lemnae TaxID=1330551 RepID=A0A848M5L5_PAELE|nr:hypothetical protein [Paenibacillus lemnae]NMO95549.1 hypothetical protein [Paenibacillus lemnae]